MSGRPALGDGSGEWAPPGPLASPVDRLTAAGIADRLRRRQRQAPTRELAAGDLPGPPRQAAVLLPLFRLEAGWRLLYIRRAEHPGDYHSGEVAFPGGQCEPRERDPAITALREAREEVGLDPGGVEVLGTLSPFLTVSGFLVTPVVGHFEWPQTFAPDPAEVARVFSIPLAWLADPTNRQARVWPSAEHAQARQVVLYDPFDGERLWGVSAAITLDLLARLGLDA